MPLCASKIRISGGHILIWQLEESIGQLEKDLPDWLDYSEYLKISHPQKKREWLAGRHLFAALCDESGTAFQGIWKSPDGKPFLLGSTAHISLSHAEHFVAAALHYESAIGIDLEKPREQLVRIAPKFLSEEELTETKGQTDLLCQYWCAKEAVYKQIGERKVSFKEHIRIVPDKSTPGKWHAEVVSPTVSGKSVVQMEQASGHYLAIALAQERN